MTVVRADPARLIGLRVTVAKKRVKGSSSLFIGLLLLKGPSLGEAAAGVQPKVRTRTVGLGTFDPSA